MGPFRIAVLVGSLRRGSYSRRVAHALMERAPKHLECEVVEIGELPLYNEDLEQQPPAAWIAFRDRLRAMAGVLFVTPEYNRSIPGCLKNALDVGSRPPGQSIFDGKPAGVVSVTPYKLGAFGANHALRQTFVFLNMPVMQQPEMYLRDAAELVDEAGAVKDAENAARLEQFMNAFGAWVPRFGSDKAADFQRFMREREVAAQAYVTGKAETLARMLATRDPVSFFSPRGDTLQGAALVAERYAADSRQFGGEGSTRLEVIQSAAEGELAFWTGLQHAEVQIEGRPSTMTLRVTEVFRVENGSFKLVHRHADALKR